MVGSGVWLALLPWSPIRRDCPRLWFTTPRMWYCTIGHIVLQLWGLLTQPLIFGAGGGWRADVSAGLSAVFLSVSCSALNDGRGSAISPKVSVALSLARLVVFG